MTTTLGFKVNRSAALLEFGTEFEKTINNEFVALMPQQLVLFKRIRFISSTISLTSTINLTVRMSDLTEDKINTPPFTSRNRIGCKIKTIIIYRGVVLELIIDQHGPSPDKP